jgi:hypothetical protein
MRSLQLKKIQRKREEREIMLDGRSGQPKLWRPASQVQLSKRWQENGALAAASQERKSTWLSYPTRDFKACPLWRVQSSGSETSPLHPVIAVPS